MPATLTLLPTLTARPLRSFTSCDTVTGTAIAAPPSPALGLSAFFLLFPIELLDARAPPFVEKALGTLSRFRGHDQPCFPAGIVAAGRPAAGGRVKPHVRACHGHPALVAHREPPGTGAGIFP